MTCLSERCETSPSTGAINGVGVGLRSQHYQYVLNHRPATPWFEALTDNYMGDGGQPLNYLEQVRNHYPITFHGVGMSLGSPNPVNKSYLQRLKERIRQFEPAWISDHLSWSAYHRHNSNELLPLPYTEESISHMAGKIAEAQDFLGERLLIENVSCYVEFKDSQIPEWEFINNIAEKADCYILLDINNIYVNAVNNNCQADDFIQNINPERIREIHLAGYEDQHTHLLDTHGQEVHQPVWDLYLQVINRLGAVPTLIEWDTDIPEYGILQQQANIAENIISTSSASHAHAA